MTPFRRLAVAPLTAVFLLILQCPPGAIGQAFDRTPPGDEHMYVGRVFVDLYQDPLQLENYTSDITFEDISIVFGYEWYGGARTFRLGSVECDDGPISVGWALVPGQDIIGRQEANCSQFAQVGAEGLNVPPGATALVPWPSSHAIEFYQSLAYITERNYSCKDENGVWHTVLPAGTVSSLSENVGHCVSETFWMKGANIWDESWPDGMFFWADPGMDSGWIEIWNLDSPLDLSFTADKESVPRGEPITYTARYANTGGVDLEEVNILATMHVPRSTELLVIDADGGDIFLPSHTLTESHYQIRWDFPTLAPGEGGEIVYQIVVSPDASDPGGWTFRHTAMIRGHQADSRARAMTRRRHDRPVAEAFPLVLRSDRAETGKAFPGDEITFTLTYENVSREGQDDVVIAVELPAHTTYVPGTAGPLGFTEAGYEPEPPRLVWNLGTVEGAQAGTATFRVQVDSCLPNGNERVQANASMQVQGFTQMEAASDQITIETLRLIKEAYQQQSRYGGPLHYMLKVENLCDCPTPPLELWDWVPEGTTFDWVDEGGDHDPEYNTVNWHDRVIPAQEERIFPVGLLVDNPPVPETDFIENRFSVGFPSGATQVSDWDSVPIGDGLILVLEPIHFGGEPHPEDLYDSNAAVFIGRVTVHPPPEDLAAYLSTLDVELEVHYRNSLEVDILDGVLGIIDGLKAEGRLTEESVSLPELWVDPASGALFWQPASWEIPIKLLDEETIITVRVSDTEDPPQVAEATVTARSEFHITRNDCLRVLDKVAARQVNLFHEFQTALVEDWFVEFVSLWPDEVTSARSLTETMYRALYCASITRDAGDLAFDLLDEKLRACNDILTTGDLFEIGTLGLSRIPTPALKLKKIPKPLRPAMERLSDFRRRIDRDILRTIHKKIMVDDPTRVQKWLQQVINPDGVPYYLKDGEATSIIMKRASDALSGLVSNFFGKPYTIEQLTEHFVSVNQAFDVIKSDLERDLYRSALSHSLLSAMENARDWKGDREQARQNQVATSNRIMAFRTKFYNQYIAGSDLVASLVSGIGTAGDWTGLVPAGLTQAVSQLETAVGVLGRNQVRFQQALSIHFWAHGLLAFTHTGMSRVVDSTQIVPPLRMTATPRMLAASSIESQLDALKNAILSENLEGVSPAIADLAGALEAVKLVEEEKTARGVFFELTTYAGFETGALAYDRFLSAVALARMDRSALSAWGMAYCLNPEDAANRTGLLEAVEAVRESQAAFEQAWADMPASTTAIPPLAVILSATTPDWLEAGVPFDLTVEIANVGVSSTPSLTVALVLPEGFVTSGADELAVGDLAAGESAVVSFEITGARPVALPAQAVLTLTGEDAWGLTHYDDRFVSLLVERASAEMTLEAPGGTVTTPGGEATVAVPAAAVEPGSRLILLPTSAPGSGGVPGAENLGGLLEIGLLDPASEAVDQFAQPLTLTLRYDPAALDGKDPSTLRIWRRDEATGTWLPLASATEPEFHEVSTLVSQGGLCGLFVSVGPEPLPIVGVQVSPDGTAIILEWSDRLEATSDLDGAWIEITDQTSPWNVPASQGRQFFRSRR